MMTPEQAVVAAIITCLAGAVLTLIVSRNKTLAGWLAFLVTTATAVFILSAVTKVLVAGPSAHPAAFWAMPRIGFALRIYVDGLTAIFLTLATVIAVPASFYSIQYMKHYADYGVARYYPYFLLFLAAMYGLLSTTDMMWFFFIFWQMMTLPGYALIRYESKKPASVRAANKYLVMMQIACAVTMVGAELLAVAGVSATHNVSLKYDFDTVSSKLPTLLAAEPGAAALAFVFFLIGFGIKMGMWPFGQVWLPDAHPAAPSPMSAMLSGVMIKTGVYGVMRYFLWLVPIEARPEYPLARWGFLIALLGTITLFTGTMQALKQEQSKRLLAFHSIGQVGYILLGIGVCMALLAVDSPATTALAALGLTGALFHVVNHGVFKGLLFLNAGSMLHATGTQDLNKLGGLMKFMPLTALTALIASFSISGVPLFNGFVSKWTIFVAAIQGSGTARYLAVCAVIAILTSALTLASFIKFFGVSFLSRPSALVLERANSVAFGSKKEAGAAPFPKGEGANSGCPTLREPKGGSLEVGLTMQLPQWFLATLCVGLGVIPAFGFRFLHTAMSQSRQGFGVTLADNVPTAGGLVSGVGELNSTAIFAPVILVSVIALLFLCSFFVSRLGSSRRRAAAPWLCGYATDAEVHRYVAHNFYGEIKRHFRWLGGAPRPQSSEHPVLRDR